MKKILYFVLFVIFGVLLYFYHSITFDNSDFEKKYNFKVDLKNDYMHFYYGKNEDPIYVFKKQLLDKYIYWSFDNKKTALLFPNQQTIADINYISNLQYAASVKDVYNAKFLTNEFNYVTNLSPFWYDVYSLSQLLLPISKNSYASEEEKLENWKKVVKLGEKGIYFNCDKNKIDNILSLSDKNFFRYAYSKTGEFYQKNKNACQNYELADNLGFNYFYYLKNYSKAIKYYKIASFQEDVPYGIIGMVSVINSFAQEHEKAIYLFIERLKGLEIKMKQKNLSEKEYKELKSYYDSTMKRLQEELNLYIIANADKNQTKCKKDYNCLLKNGYIQKEIEKNINICKNMKGLSQIRNITDIKGENEIQIAKCVLLSIGLQSGYIQKNKLISPLLNSPFYWYDKNKGNWLAYKK